MSDNAELRTISLPPSLAGTPRVNADVTEGAAGWQLPAIQSLRPSRPGEFAVRVRV